MKTKLNPTVIEYRFKETIIDAMMANGKWDNEKSEDEQLSALSLEDAVGYYCAWIGIGGDFVPPLIMLIEQLQRASSPFLNGVEPAAIPLREHMIQYLALMTKTNEVDDEVSVSRSESEGIPGIIVEDFGHDGPNNTGLNTLIRFHDRS